MLFHGIFEAFPGKNEIILNALCARQHARQTGGAQSSICVKLSEVYVAVAVPAVVVAVAVAVSVTNQTHIRHTDTENASGPGQQMCATGSQK